MFEQGHLTLSQVGYFYHFRHLYYSEATCLKEGSLTSATQNPPLVQVVCRREAHLQRPFSSTFKVLTLGGGDRGVTRSFSLRDQFLQRGQSSVDADVQSVFKIVARKILLEGPNKR